MRGPLEILQKRLALIALASLVAFVSPATEPKLKVASFCCDVTPPIGHPLCGGWIKPLVAVDEPLLAKGILISDGKTRYILCAVDWCLLQTAAHDLFRQKLATATETPLTHISVQTVHQHNAPIADINAQLLLNQIPGAPPHLDLAFMQDVTDRVAAAAKAASQELRPFTYIGFGSNRVDRFASNRRVRLRDDQIHPRYSSSDDPQMQAAPEGLIDPWLRTVTFFDGTKPLVRLHYYASHPQSFYGDGRATSDTVGLARQHLEQEEGIPQIYFTGCAGNITAGKYNNGSPSARIELTDRIYLAMKNAIATSQRVPVTSLEWKTRRVRLPMRTEPEWLPERARSKMSDSNAPVVERLEAALNLAWIQRVQRDPDLEISRLTLGPVNILDLPGEAFVEYQLYAQSLYPSSFVAVAAYGEAGAGYICTDASFAEGGYEPTESRVAPPTEFILKEALAKLLETRGNSIYPPTYVDKSHLLSWRDRGGVEHQVKTPVQWSKRRTDTIAAMQLVMGSVPPASRRVPLDLRTEASERFSGFTRKRISFESETGDRVPAFLLLPNLLKGKAPAMLCLHQTTPVGKAEPAGLIGSANLHYAQELAERGYIALAPDYPNFGDYKIDPYAEGYASATMKGIWNHMRSVDLLVSLPEVDPNRIGVIGHSLGGHNALLAAAFDPRLKAVITSCGFNSFFSYGEGDLTGWSHRGYMPLITLRYGNDPKQMPFDFSEVLASVAPRAVFINAPMGDANFPVTGVMDCVAAARPVYALLRAPDHLVVEYPACGHDFPSDVRAKAYAWLDRLFR
jgi:pimeloyl-ACP methyl ester carboxylesterase